MTTSTYGYTRKLEGLSFGRRSSDNRRAAAGGLRRADGDRYSGHAEQKLNIDGRNYKILGACNPPLAHRALQAEPLNRVAPALQRRRLRGGRRHDQCLGDQADEMFKLVGNPAVAPVAAEVDAKLRR